jgi:hypothetical protein
VRQFFSWRLWAAFGAIVALALVARAVLPESKAETAPAEGPPERRVDFVSLVYSVERTPDFRITGGTVAGAMDLVLDGQRTMRIVEGTLGDVSCDQLDELNACAVVADLLGDAAVWFALVPASSTRIETAPIVELVDGGLARLGNGWLIRHAGVVDRQCSAETRSLTDFIERFGPGSTTIVDISTQRVIAVRCAEDASEG